MVAVSLIMKNDSLTPIHRPFANSLDNDPSDGCTESLSALKGEAARVAQGVA